MANMAASGVSQQMLVPTPYHYHQSQCQVNATLGLPSQANNKKENKKRKKIIDKSVTDRKKSKAQVAQSGVGLVQSNFSSVVSLSKNGNLDMMPIPTLTTVDNLTRFEACPVCNKKKCFKHLDPKSRSHLSKKTPEDVIIQMKKHMLKLLSNQDCSNFCKVDTKVSKVDVDITKMHQMYLHEYEPSIAEVGTSLNNTTKESKPKVKKWLYRKIFLDEFKTFEFSSCKGHLGDLRRNIDTVIQQKKKKVTKTKQAPPQTSSNQMTPQDYSLSNNNLPNGNPGDMLRPPGLPPGVLGPPHNQAANTPSGYQPNLMGLENSSNASMIGGSPALHNSLTSYVTQQVPLLFGQQQTQQQPLNLQTSSHQGPLQHQGAHPSHPVAGGAPPAPGATHPPLPLNLHNPYYVSFGPMLPLHMSPQHNHQQQFQQNLMPPQQHTFNQHAMYQ